MKIPDIKIHIKKVGLIQYLVTAIRNGRGIRKIESLDNRGFCKTQPKKLHVHFCLWVWMLIC